MNCTTSRLLAFFFSLMALDGAWAQGENVAVTGAATSAITGAVTGAESASVKTVPQVLSSAKDTQEPKDPSRLLKSEEWFFSWGYYKTHY